MQPLINIGNSFIWSKCKETGVTIYDAENDMLFRLLSSFLWAAHAFSIILEEFISLLMFALTYVCHLPYSMGHLLVLLITSVRVPLIVYLSLDQYWNVHFNAYVGSLDWLRRTSWTTTLIWWHQTLVMLIQTVLCSRMTQMTGPVGALILRWDCQFIKKMRWVYYSLGIWLLKN